MTFIRREQSNDILKYKYKKGVLYSLKSNKKIAIIGTIIAAGLIITLATISLQNAVGTSGAIWMVISRSHGPIQPGEKFVSLSDTTMSNFPTILKGIPEADKMYEKFLAVCHGVRCPGESEPPTSYNIKTSLNEAKLALATLGFHDIPYLDKSRPPLHVTIIEYHGNYYGITIIGI